MSMILIKTNHQRGFALLMSLLIIGVVISVTMAIVELSLKQLELSVNSRDSEIAFAAANAGMECAKLIRRSASSTIESGQTTDFACFSNNADTNPSTALVHIESGGSNGSVYRYQPEIDWSSSDRCSQIDMVTMVINSDASGPLVIGGSGNNSLKKIFSGYPNDTKSCDPGGRCTLVSVRGYSAKCADKSNPGTLMREILLEF